MTQQEAEKILNLTDKEKALILRHKLDFSQIRWMRYICANKCGGNWDLFFQQYPLTSGDAFLVSGKCRFNVLALKRIQDSTVNEGIPGDFAETHDKISWLPRPNGLWRMWEPRKEGGVYMSGSDVAEGSTIDGKVFGSENSTDYSTCEIFNAKTCEQVCEYQGRLEPNVFAEELFRANKYYNKNLLGVERNSQGLAVLYPLREKNVNLFYMENFDKQLQVRRKKLGWLTNKITKYDIISVLDEYIREGKIIIHSPFLLSELMTFIRFADGTIGGVEGTHDDLVIAVAIALRMLRYVNFSNTGTNATQAKINAALSHQMKNVHGY